MRDQEAARVGFLIRQEARPFRPISIFFHGAHGCETYLVSATLTVFMGTTETHFGLVGHQDCLILNWDEFAVCEDMAIERSGGAAIRSRFCGRAVLRFAFPLPIQTA